MRASAPETPVAREQRAGLVDSAFYLAATVIGRAAQLLAVPLLVRVLSPAEFGTFDLALVGITLLATALLMGTDSGVAPEYARCDAQDLPALRAIFVASCRVPLVLWTIASVVLALVQLSGLVSGAPFRSGWLMAVSALLFALLSCLVGLLRWTARARMAAALTALMGVVPLGGALLVALAVAQPTSEQMLGGLAAGYAVAAAAAAALTTPLLRGLGAVAPAFGTWSLLRRSWTMGIASLASPARRSVERLVILALLGESALAAYAVLARVAQVLEIALQALGNGLYPRALRLLSESAGRALAVRALRMHWLASMTGVIVLAAAASPVLELMGASAFSGSPYLLPMVAAAACLSALPFSAGMAYFHAQRIPLYAGMLMLNGLASLALAWAGAWMTQSLAGWCAGMLIGSAVVSLEFLRVSERLHPVGYAMPPALAGLGALLACGMLPIVVTG